MSIEGIFDHKTQPASQVWRTAGGRWVQWVPPWPLSILHLCCAACTRSVLDPCPHPSAASRGQVLHCCSVTIVTTVVSDSLYHLVQLRDLIRLRSALI